MQQTTNYNLLIPEGTDVVNPLTQVNPNFQTIDGAMFANKQASIGTATEVVTGTVHAINRNNPDSDVFRFTATGAWTAGDTMTLDGQSVTVHLSDGTTPATNSYIIGAEVLAMVNGSLVTLAISTTPPAQGVTSFNSRTGAVVPTASDYDASMIDYDNTTSGLAATDTQAAIDEVVDHFVYSTTEKYYGKWIDGSDLYTKTFVVNALPNNTTEQFNHGISNLNEVVSAVETCGNNTLWTDFNAAEVVIRIYPTYITLTDTADYSALKAYITLIYTKTP